MSTERDIDDRDLHTTFGTRVEARDRVNGYVLLRGLGAMGVGQMWFKEEPRHADYPGYGDAPERDSAGGFGR